jgi:hypothetical protein
MPGTILVSGTEFYLAYTIQAYQPHVDFLFDFSILIFIIVLEFMDLPFSSSTSIRGMLLFLLLNFSLFHLLSTSKVAIVINECSFHGKNGV